MTDEIKLEGIVVQIAKHHGKDSYGLKLDTGLDRWFNGFDLPPAVVEGSCVMLVYHEKTVADQVYYNVTELKVKDLTGGNNRWFQCPRCKLDLEVAPADTQ